MGKTSDSRGRTRGIVRADGPSKEAAATARPRAFAGYQDALRFLNERTNYERMRPEKLGTDAFRLDRMRALLECLGEPERDVKCVHVAGSKGKGSTVEMTAACLAGCGYTTGVYTSPHLVHLRERVRINGECVTHAQFTALMSRVAGAAAAVEAAHGPLTFFEVMTALSLLHFAEQAVDIAVIETGLGGRLDCTNVVTPEVTAVTAIQLEHTQILGNSLPEIAREKAGIFKAGVPAVVAPQPEPVLAVFREVAGAVGAPLAVLGQDIEFTHRFEADPVLGPHARVSVTTPRSEYEHLPCPMKGEHQAVNCGLALAVLDRLTERGFECPPRKVAEGLAKTSTLGRMELVCTNPRILIDGAHTPESILCLVKSIGATLRYDSMVVIFGCASDKDLRGMLSRIALGADKIIFTRAANNPRAVEPREMQRALAEISPKMSQVAKDLPSALTLAARAVGRDDMICVTGSFYLAGEAKKYVADLASRQGKGKAGGK
jgi:dihydrofolate synthase / folylpolyglutamate synthase